MPGYSEFNHSGDHSKNRSRFRLPIKGFLLCAIFLFPNGLLKAAARSDHRPLPVTLHVAVSDRNGEPVENLQAADFQVFEKKKLQKITRLRFERNAPVSLGVLVDVSKSMEGGGIRLALKLLKRLAAKLESPDELFVNAFSNESQELLDYMAPEDYLEDAVDNLGTGGRPHMGLALDLALIKLRDASNSNRAILFISAGRDIAGPATLDHIAQHRYPIYALGIEGAISFRTRIKILNIKGSALKVYADHSGGSAFFVETQEEAAGPLEMLPYRLKNRFVLEYLSTHPKRDGKSRKIRVAVSHPQYQVRYLKQYQAPRPGQVPSADLVRPRLRRSPLNQNTAGGNDF